MRHHPLEGQALLAQQPADLLLAVLDRLLAALLGEPVADLAARPRRLHERAASRGTDPRSGDLEVNTSTTSPCSSSDSSGTRRPLTLRADGVVTDLGVDRVGEVDRGRADRQADHVSPRREHEDLGAVDLEAQRVEELARVLDLVLPVEQLPQPLHVGVASAVGGSACRRRCATSSLYFQWAATPYSARRCIADRADLHLHGLAGRADHGRVQRLVHVELRHRDVVLEPAGERVPAVVQHAEDAVAVRVGVDEDADADEVVDVGELAAAVDHLLVDRVVVLRSPGHPRVDLGGRAGPSRPG